MYDVPGQDKISEHSFLRYLREKENFQEAIQKSALSSTIESPETIHLREIETNAGIARQHEFEKKAGGISIDDIPQFIRKGLLQNKNQPDNQKSYVESIGNARDEVRASLLLDAFDIENEEVELACVKAISNIPKKERTKLIRVGLSKESFRVKKASVAMIRYAPEELRAKMILLGLSDRNIELAKIYAKVIYCVQEEKDKRNLFEIAKQKLGNALVEPPLYDDADISDERFLRKDFVKTGSRVTLIGGELKDKVIFRHITPEAFRSWQEAYDNHDIWKRAGFDYVPIEPIVSFHQTKDGLVDVASGVLDISFGDWKKMSRDFSIELDKERSKIIRVLREAGITHGHAHEDNFCLRFFRKANGVVDYQKKPRIYLIDFDRAISPK